MVYPELKITFVAGSEKVARSFPYKAKSAGSETGPATTIYNIPSLPAIAIPLSATSAISIAPLPRFAMDLIVPDHVASELGGWCV